MLWHVAQLIWDAVTDLSQGESDEDQCFLTAAPHLTGDVSELRHSHCINTAICSRTFRAHSFLEDCILSGSGGINE